MRHFLFEFITGGGLSGEPLHKTLIEEGELMMGTLLNELSERDDAEITLCRDSRLPLDKDDIKQHIVESNLDDILNDQIKISDVCWLIAPETNACLEKYAKLFVTQGKLFIGSSPEAIKLTTSKFLTNQFLADNDINSVETKWLNQILPESNNGWVIKADDGVGAEDTYLMTEENDVNKFVKANDYKNVIVQPYLDGKHMSMSLLVLNSDVCLLACNQQYIEINDGCFKLKGIGVNECLSYKNKMLSLAEKITSAISGLAGFIGVDLIAVNDELFVVEINPRFTTSYAGISESIGSNVASMVLNTFINKKIPDIDIDSAMPVRINI